MKKTLCLLALLLASVSTAFGTHPVTPESLGPVKYEIRYKLGAINSRAAEGTITLEKSTWNGREALHSHAAISARSIFKLFMKADYVVDLYLTPTDVAPLYYINPFVRDGQDGKVEFTYDRNKREIHSVAVRPPAGLVSETISMNGNTMDLLALLQHVRFLEIPEGGSVSFNLMKSGTVIPATLTLRGLDEKRYPGKQAERLQLKFIGGGLMENGSGSLITVWRSADSDRRILGLETTLSSGTMIVNIKE